MEVMDGRRRWGCGYPTKLGDGGGGSEPFPQCWEMEAAGRTGVSGSTRAKAKARATSVEGVVGTGAKARSWGGAYAALKGRSSTVIPAR